MKLQVIRLLKRLGKKFLAHVLEWQVRRLRRKHQFQVVAVAGSVGKTSVKSAVAHVLATHGRVRYQDGNYNDRLTVPLVFFGEAEPKIFDVSAWLRVLRANERQIRGDFPIDVVVAELGTDAPGQLAEFAYLRPEIGVVTAIAEEHMEFFKDLAGVAREELELTNFAQQTICNSDDIATQYLTEYEGKTYGTNPDATYRLVNRASLAGGDQELTLQLAGNPLTVRTSLKGLQGAKTVLAAAAVASELGMTGEPLAQALGQLRAVAGRMQLLAGKQGSQLIDDTYNASPVAIKAALDVVYASDAPQKIAILGSMNELGPESPSLHEEVGAYCLPDQLDLVVTIGADAEHYLAPVAIKAGCKVQSYASPYDAGAAVLAILQPQAIVLAKGSQNRVYAEEALKMLLANPDDAQKLVRQSEHWLSVKQRQFPH